MRATLFTLAALLTLTATAHAQRGRAVQMHRQPAQQVRFSHHTCGADRYYCDDCVGDKGGPSGSPSDSLGDGPANGQFIAPPATGSVMGGSNSYGVEGMALHFPSMTLKLPTLQLPNMFRIRKNPRMLLDPAQAPYVQQSPQTQSVGAVPALSIPPSPSNTPGGPDASPGDGKSLQRSGQKTVYLNDDGQYTTMLEQRLRQREEEIARMSSQLDRLEQAMQRLAQTNDRPEPPKYRQASLMTPIAKPGRQRPAALVAPRAARPIRTANESASIRRLPPVGASQRY